MTIDNDNFRVFPKPEREYIIRRTFLTGIAVALLTGCVPGDSRGDSASSPTWNVRMSADTINIDVPAGWVRNSLEDDVTPLYIVQEDHQGTHSTPGIRANYMSPGVYLSITSPPPMPYLEVGQHRDSFMNSGTKTVLDDAARVIHYVVSLVIRIAPYGVFGLVTATVATTGFSTFDTYARLIAVLLGSMAVVALIVNPLMVWAILRQNPYPLVWRCLTQSGIPAFFTRSSAANIPINLDLCEALHIREETYSISIPLGANINMAGAAITIAVLSLAAANTIHVPVHPLNALLLCFLATLGAAGASGVPGGSLMLIPMACSLLGIDGDTSAQVIAIGVLIGIIQDSAETALNSSSDVLFTAAADLADQRKTAAVSAS